jgi:hypothetical protein
MCAINIILSSAVTAVAKHVFIYKTFLLLIILNKHRKSEDAPIVNNDFVYEPYCLSSIICIVFFFLRTPVRAYSFHFSLSGCIPNHRIISGSVFR